jgi:hypothetical protein
MAATFDPYHKWLGISPKDQPPDHYRLLAIDRFESDLDVIVSAADRQMSHIRSFQTGEHSELSQKILSEIAWARVCLLNPKKKEEYDRQLRQNVLPPAPARSPGGPTPKLRVSSPTAIPTKRGGPTTVSQQDDELGPEPFENDPLGGLLEEELTAGAVLYESTPKPRKRSPKVNFSPGAALSRIPRKMRNYLIALALFLIGGIVVLSIPEVAAPVYLCMVAGGMLAMLVSGLWCLGIAFSEDILCGLLWIVVPFYNLYFIISRFQETKKPLALMLIGILLYVGSIPVLISAFSADGRPPWQTVFDGRSRGNPDTRRTNSPSQVTRFEYNTKMQRGHTGSIIPKYITAHLSDGGTRQMLLYLPPGHHDEKSLACVLIAPAGSNLITGNSVGRGNSPELLPYVRAGLLSWPTTLRERFPSGKTKSTQPRKWQPRCGSSGITAPAGTTLDLPCGSSKTRSPRSTPGGCTRPDTVRRARWLFS